MIINLDELKLIMRSLGMSPIIPELNAYMKEKGKITFNFFQENEKMAISL
jgi:hypothetical protein